MEDLYTCDYCGNDSFESPQTHEPIECAQCGGTMRFVTTYPNGYRPEATP